MWGTARGHGLQGLSNARATVPAMTLRDSFGFWLKVALPTWNKGILIRRRSMVRVSAGLDLDNAAVARMQALREAYGDGPVLIRNPIRPQALLLASSDVQRVLNQTPDPFSPASSEKRAALAHFEPHVSLISAGPERAERRAFNDQVLDSARPMHRLADGFRACAEQEVEALLHDIGPAPELTWANFIEAWSRMARRIILGDGARDDRALTDLLARLRGRANWAFMVPKRRGALEALQARLSTHLARGEPGSLAGLIATMRPGAAAAIADQVTHWLFAMEPAGITAMRALTLLAAHPAEAEKAQAEVSVIDNPGSDLPYLRACILETLRLYPTTPVILRQTTQETAWSNGTLPSGSGILIFVPYFQREEQRYPDAHRFRPITWLGLDPAHATPFIPFSGGPGICPAHNLVPLLAASFLAAIVRRYRVAVHQPVDLVSSGRLPGTLDHFRVRLGLG